MPKGNHSKSNFLNIKALPGLRSALSNIVQIYVSEPILKSGLSNVVTVQVSDGTPVFDVPSIENVDKHAIQSTDYRRIQDRLRTTATLKHQQPGEMRIRTVREDGATVSILAFKKSAISANLTESIRIRSVLKENDYKLPYSEWVNYDHLGEEEAQEVNQYRIRGVSKEMLNSQWVYSNIRNKENEEILFKLLHDFLDVTLNVYDDQIDIVTDFILGDKMIMLIKEHAPEMYNAMDLNEELKYRLSELLAIHESYIPNTLEEEMVAHLLEAFSLQLGTFYEAVSEYFYASIEEFTVLMQTFKFEDHLNFVLTDEEKMAQVLLALEDSYEKIVKQSNLEVFLSNGSNSSLFLESCFELDVKAENISEYFNIAFSDMVVSTIQSTVQLLVSQEVSDIADAVIQDVPYTEFLGFMNDVLPMLKLLEEAETMMLMHAKDNYDINLRENPIQYMLFDENNVFNVELLYEVFSFIGEEFLNLHIDADRFDLFTQVFSEKHLIMVDRLVEEFFKYSITDEYKTTDTKERLDYISEVYQNRILSDFDIAIKKVAVTPADEYRIERIEDALIMSSILYYDHYDLDYLGYGVHSGANNTGGESENGDVSTQSTDIHNTSTISDRSTIPQHLATRSLGEHGGGDLSYQDQANGYRGFTLLTSNEERIDRYKEGKQIGLIHDSQKITMLEFLSMMNHDESLVLESKGIFVHEMMKYASSFEDEFGFKEAVKLSKNEHAYRLVSFLLRETMPTVLPEKMLYKYLINLADHYIMEGHEKIQYGLITKEGEYPLGKFIVGTNTISGEEEVLL